MGSSVSIAEDGKMNLPPLEDFKKQIESACAYDNGAQKDELKEYIKAAHQIVIRKLRENSVGKIPYPPQQDQLDELWAKLDYNGNNMSSLAELDKMISESYPEYNNKPAIIRAYRAIDRNQNGFISKHEFTDFFGYLDYFTKLWHKFEHIDDDGDRRISFEEMLQHSEEIFGRKLTKDQAVVLFHALDRNNGGKVLFYEFCAYMAGLDKKDFSVDKLPFE